ncbi:ABC transporter permease [Mobiluncus mulieris]|uniref:ABC transporter permease n=1 Tax=Mobiluncus mulieris TaxID=2052 RepID=A0A7Y0U168_9ACTO|nr:ABC transporter permease [Mobiluncus mulieris]NMW65065.1 ABC transporter permease [Mobiluncus mulieris]
MKMDLKILHMPKTRTRHEPVIAGQESVLVAVIAGLWIIMGLATPTFVSPESVFAILYSVVPIAIMALAMTPIMCTGGIDVSVGSSMAVCMAVVGQLLVTYNIPALLAVFVSVAVGAALGAINGLIIAFGRVPAMVATFGTLNLFRYIALQVFGDKQISGVPDTLRIIGGDLNSSVLGIPNALLLAMLIGLAVWFYMRQCPTGRHIYAIGDDSHAAYLAGIKVRRRVFELYVASGIAVGIAAVVSIGTGGFIQQNVGFGLEMSVIAACVIGGTSVLGGSGTVLGSFLGAVLVGSVQAAVTHLHLPNQLTLLFVGLVIILAVGIDLLRQQRRNKR